MRIQQLDLIAFGPFTGTSLDFSRGEEGLNMVYGPNEAGKSSSLRAIADLFYGMHPRTPDDFVHPYSKLRIGAQLRHSDRTHLNVIRRKANRNSLRCGQDRDAVSDVELARFIGDVDRDLFQTLFGIDHTRLRLGGADILRGGGRIGEMLFSAGAGLTGLKAVQAELAKESNDLLTATGRAGAIYAGIKEFQAAREAVGKAQVSVDTWLRHDESLRLANKNKVEIDTAIRKKRSEQNRLTRIKNSLRVIALWRQASTDLAALGDVPFLAEDFSEKANALQFTLRQSEQEERSCAACIASLNEKLEALVLPDSLLADADAVEALRDRLGGYREALNRQPSLETESALAEQDAKEILRRLGRPEDTADIESLRVPKEQIVRIQNLANQRDGIGERLQSARRDRDRIQRSIREAERRLMDLKVVQDAPSIRSRVAAIQNEGELESQLSRVSLELQELEADASVQLNQLTLWSGNLEAAERLPVPSLSSIEEFDAEFNRCQTKLAGLEERLREERESLQHTKLELDDLERESAVPSVSELERSREQRQHGWQLVLDAWDGKDHVPEVVDEFVTCFPPSDDLRAAFESSVHAADKIADQLRSDADRVASKSKLRKEEKQREGSVLRYEDEFRQAASESENCRGRWQKLWTSIGIEPLSPVAMRDWSRQHHELVQVSKEIRSKQLDKEHLEHRITKQLEEVTSVLTTIAPESERDGRSLSELLKLASDTCDEIQRSEALRENTNGTLEDLRIELVESEELFGEAELQQKHWQSDWAAAMGLLGLKDNAIPAQANSVLNDTESLFQKYREADQARTQLDGIRREAQRFEEDVREVSRRVATDISDKPVEEIVSLLAKRLQDARVMEEAKSSHEEQRALEVKKRNLADEEFKSATVALDEMCRQAQCVSYEELSTAFTQSQRRRQLEESKSQFATQIISQSGGQTFDAFVAEAENEANEVDSLEPRIDELGHEIERLESENETHIREIEREESELAKIDGSALAADRALECESIAARLEEQLQELAVIRLSSAVLHEAIENYREKNQAPILNRASVIFSKITLENFKELRAEFTENGEHVLAAIRREDDTAITVEQMSDGTLDQLYLALRIAVLESWLERHEPIPFIIDDVLTNFDDERAIATLDVFAELSRYTQVIFFTHHSHLVDIAKRNVSESDLFIVELANASMMENGK